MTEDWIIQFSDTQQKIVSELAQAFAHLNADKAIFTILGSWGDTLPDQEILQMIRQFNSASAELLRQQRQCTFRAGSDRQQYAKAHLAK